MPTIQGTETRAKAILKETYGSDATFRDDQYEAIEATLTKKRTLIVQKTGWGKSIVYFIAARLLKEDGRGFTIVVSPLLVLMEDQIRSAENFGLHCDVLNSKVRREDRSDIIEDVVDGKTDVLFITPENLFSDDVQDYLNEMDIALFVIDEAHCLSDWGHDFRLNYGRLYSIIDDLPQKTAVLCTTATANDRVVDDLKHHLGEEVYVSRGDLMRKSLCLQTIELQSKAERYAWIADHLNELPGTGIIYCLTKRDCENLSDFLNAQNIDTLPYYSRNKEEEYLNDVAIEKFKNDEIKAIVATIKLGMGYDKGNVGFVIHFQRPKNIVTYYQQIGRAGRNGDKAYAILLSGVEDDEIQEYFIDTAFPTKDLCEEILSCATGISYREILTEINDRKTNIDKAIGFLVFNGYLKAEKENRKTLYYRTTKAFEYDQEKYDEITSLRIREMDQMRDLMTTDECLLDFTVKNLNNPISYQCGHCKNCIGKPLIATDFSDKTFVAAQEFLDDLVLYITPRKQLATTKSHGQAKIKHPLKLGICLSKYGDIGYGSMVKHDKYKADEYRNDLLQKSVHNLSDVVEKQDIQALTYIPSSRNTKVKDFAKKLADALGLKFFDVIKKNTTTIQKIQENAEHRCANAENSYSIAAGTNIPYNILLVDDILDSGWTMTVCGNLLIEKAGVPDVFPFCLAASTPES